MLDADEAAAMLGATRCSAARSRRTARWSTRPGWCAGWPGWSRRAGVPIHEQTRVRAIAPGRVETDAGTVRAEVVLRATEGYTRQAAPACGGPWRRCTR